MDSFWNFFLNLFRYCSCNPSRAVNQIVIKSDANNEANALTNLCPTFVNWNIISRKTVMTNAGDNIVVTSPTTILMVTGFFEGFL